ncbi:hypothetical protein L1049_023740 [Liquidambar formosana]|uniref:BHLH domain-containing protein n=1 Tax=Liquidambar formosana TaxID=63359 RepID=A0AAP0RTK4_LIQFO
MESIYWSSDLYGADFSKLSDGFSENSVMRSGSCSSSSSLVLDSERGELVKAPATLVRKEVSAEKAMAALRIHSDAERRRRGRINAHFATLRSLIPGTNKMDKASLLAEVISHLKELKRNAAEASNGLLIPMDVDEVRVEQQEDGPDEAPYFIMASICCKHKTEVLSEIRQALEVLHLKMVRAEIATLGGRLKILFLMTGFEEGNIEDTKVRKLLATSVHRALRSVVDKFPGSEEFLSRTILSNKRQRVLVCDSRSSSLLGDFWLSVTSMENSSTLTCRGIE